MMVMAYYDDYYGSEDDDEIDDDEYSYDRAKWDEEENQFLVSHKPQDWPTLSTPSKNKTSQKEPAPKMMLMLSSTSSSHTYDFPDYQTFENDNLIHAPKIPQKKVILPTGEHMPASHIEATLNWQS
ncbi:hypothetical protein KY289_026684 [Solanum tuberosum]|nr:hypothetical protein KY289_026684 [Solanum tuberosum]